MSVNASSHFEKGRSVANAPFQSQHLRLQKPLLAAAAGLTVEEPCSPAYIFSILLRVPVIDFTCIVNARARGKEGCRVERC